MAKFQCLDCDSVFEECEISRVEESRGEYCGALCFETVPRCPYCNGEYEKLFQCEMCGEWHFEEDVFSGVCENCIEAHEHDYKTCEKIGRNEKKPVEINCFFASVFSVEEIEEILHNALKEHGKHGYVSCEKFISADKEWFAEKLLEVYRNGE